MPKQTKPQIQIFLKDSIAYLELFDSQRIAIYLKDHLEITEDTEPLNNICLVEKSTEEILMKFHNNQYFESWDHKTLVLAPEFKKISFGKGYISILGCRLHKTGDLEFYHHFGLSTEYVKYLKIIE